MAKQRMGRPAAGPDGEKVSEYPTLTISMRAETKARLKALSTITHEPAWRLLEEALEVYIRTNLSRTDLEALDATARSMRRHAK